MKKFHSFFADLSRIGKLVQFGSSIDKTCKNPNDLDVAIIIQNGTYDSALEEIESTIDRHSLDDVSLVQNLFGYRKPRPVGQKHLFHFLVCEEKSLCSRHSILDSLASGFELSF